MIIKLAVKLWRGINKFIIRNVPVFLLGVQHLDLPYETLGNSDGAWSIPVGSINSESVCYCVGVGKDISFDLDLQKKYRCSVYSFDPTPSSIDYITSLGELPISFKPWGIWGKDVILNLYPQGRDNAVNLSTIDSHRGEKVCDIECFRLKTIMKKLGHDKIDLLKIDIEGAWMEVIEDIVDSNIVPHILCVEFDSPTSLLKVRRAVCLLKSIGLLFVCRQRDNYIFSVDSTIIS